MNEHLDCRVYWGHSGCDLPRGHGLYTAIKLLAVPYAANPGYREEWAP